MNSICQYTNSYAWANIANKQSYADKDGDQKTACLAGVETVPSRLKM